jgi:hypothetical protein
MALSQLQELFSEFSIETDPLFLQMLNSFLEANHPGEGEQEQIYHNLDHSLEVASLVLDIISQRLFNNKWIVLGCVASLFHDIDPERQPHTPPMVERTIQYLENNLDAQAIINYLCSVFGFTPKQIYTLILATDYSPDPEERDNKWIKFRNECVIHFDEGDVYMAQYLGKILAYADKSATYIQPIDVVVKRIKGLALELRTVNDSNNPTNEQMFKGTVVFINDLIQSDNYVCLPPIHKQSLEVTRTFFSIAYSN